MKNLFNVMVVLVLSVTAAKAQGDASNGKQLFMSYNCYACHGFSGQNGSGARLVPMKLTQAAFTTYIRNPRSMPSYSAKVLPDAVAGDIYAYVKTLPDMSKATKDIPLLTEIINSAK
jgi:mono/diheme cytochrome c family protein